MEWSIALRAASQQKITGLFQTTPYFSYVKFDIVIQYERKNIRLKVERVLCTPELEKYKVTARNNSFVLQTNRPLLIGKGLKHKPAIWRMVEGDYHRRYILELIIKAIEAKLKTL